MKKKLLSQLSRPLSLVMMLGLSTATYANSYTSDYTIPWSMRSETLEVNGATLTIPRGSTYALASTNYVDNTTLLLTNNATIELHGTIATTGGKTITTLKYDSGTIKVYLNDGAKINATFPETNSGTGAWSESVIQYIGYNAATDGNGTVSVKNGSADVTSESAGYKSTTYTFTANPAKGYKFVNWTKGKGGAVLDTDASINVTCGQNEQYQVYANFEKNTTPYDLVAASSEYGTVAFSVDGATVTQASKGDVVSVAVAPNDGYSAKAVTVKAFTSWDVEPTGGSEGTPSLQNEVDVTKNDDGTWQFTMPEAKVWVVATYAKNLQDAWIQTITDQTYMGAEIKPTVTVKDSETTLTENTDYTVSYTSNINAGTATVTITAVEGSDYSGTAKATFTIKKADINVTAPTAKTDLTYTGEPQALVEAGTASYGTMKYSTDNETWTETVPTGTNATEYTVYYKVDGDDNHNAVDADSLTVSIAKAAADNINPTVTFADADPAQVGDITVKVGNKELVKDQDYTVTYKDKSGNAVTEEEIKNAMDEATEDAEYTVVVTLTGNYSGSKEKTFTVKAATVAVLTIPAKCYISYFSAKGLNLADGTNDGVFLTSVKSVTENSVVLYDKGTVTSAAKETPLVICNTTEEELKVTLRVNESAVSVTYDSEHYFGTNETKEFTSEDMTNADYYVLDGKNFTWVKDAGTLPANRCWLQIAAYASASPRVMSIRFESDEITSINTVNDNATDDAEVWYDLNGRLLQGKPATKGVFIHNGIKVVIK